jgi:hypothetical protein
VRVIGPEIAFSSCSLCLFVVLVSNMLAVVTKSPDDVTAVSYQACHLPPRGYCIRGRMRCTRCYSSGTKTLLIAKACWGAYCGCLGQLWLDPIPAKEIAQVADREDLFGCISAMIGMEVQSMIRVY